MSPLRDRRFALLVAGQAVNGIGSWCALIALWGYAAYRFHASPAEIALLSVSWSLPAALLGPLGGVPVDRFGPRRTLVAADAFAAVIAVALAFTQSFALLVILGGFIGLARVFSEPAFSALAPRLVDDEHLLRANALLGAAMMSSIAFGPILAAGAIAVGGPRSAFLIDAITYAVGIAVVIPLRLKSVARDDHTAATHGTWADLRAGLDIVHRRPAVREILGLASSVYLVWGAYAVIEPIYVRDVLHRSPATFAMLQAAFGIMLLVNTLLVSRVGERAARFATLRWSALGAALAAPVYIGTGWVVVAFCGIAIWGASTAWLVAPRDTLLQRATPVAAHGRVLAIDSALRSSAHVVALPVAALVVGAFGVRAAAFGFALFPLLGLLATRQPASDLRPRAEDAPRVDARFVAVAPADQ